MPQYHADKNWRRYENGEPFSALANLFTSDDTPTTPDAESLEGGGAYQMPAPHDIELQADRLPASPSVPPTLNMQADAITADAKVRQAGEREFDRTHPLPTDTPVATTLPSRDPALASDSLASLLGHGGMSDSLQLSSLRGERMHELEQRAPTTVMGGGKSAGDLLGMLRGEQAADPDTGTEAHAEIAYNEPLAKQQRDFEIKKIEAAHPNQQMQALGANGVLSPEAEAIVKSIGNYEQQLPTGAALRTPYWTQILGEVAKRDPSFDATQYGTRQSLKKDYASGPTSKNLKALNTTIMHLQELSEKAGALNNGDYPAWNSIANFFSSHTGGTAVPGYEAQATGVSGELASALKGNATDVEIAKIQHELSTSNSPQQQREVINSFMRQLSERLYNQRDHYMKTNGAPKDFDIVSPDAEAVLSKYGLGDRGSLHQQPAESAPTRKPIRGGGFAEMRNGQWVRVE